MNDYLKNPIVYCILVPSVIALWMAYTLLIAMPNSAKAYAKAEKTFKDSQPLIDKVIALAPEKIIQAGKNGKAFDYDNVISKVASVCRIPASSVTPNIRGKVKQNRQEIQDATVVIADVTVSKFATFLSLSLNMWPDLQCERLKMTRLKGPKDNWKADVNFRYFY